MGKQTNIAWTQSTLNLAWGCTKVSEECRNCYMYRLSERFGRDPYKVQLLGPHQQTWYTTVRTLYPYSNIEGNQGYINYVEKRIGGMSDLVFVNSMSDTFHKDIPDFVLTVWFEAFARHPEKQFQILTKRPERAVKYFQNRKVPDNCWIGTSVGIKNAIDRLNALRLISARIRFLSLEPLLEDLGDVDFRGIHWAIIGGESDYNNPRQMKKEWVISLVVQLKRDGVKIFFKQWGGKGGDNAGGNVCPCCNSVHQEFPSK